MTDDNRPSIHVSKLRIGTYVYLDMGWLEHPFPVSHFKISTQEQIDTIRSLGVEHVRCDGASVVAETAAAEAAVVAAPHQLESAEQAAARERRALLNSQQAQLQLCERQYQHAAQVYKHISETLPAQALQARQQSEQLIQGFVGQLLGHDEIAIRLLSERAGEKSALHSLNVTVLSLLLGKALQLRAADLQELGVAALLHDIGKTELPDRLRWLDEHFNFSEKQIYQEHVAHGLALARKMELTPSAMLAIAQHHEHMDGSGYPSRLGADKISPLARIVALVNRYDNLCNPANPTLAVTPHEALSHIFTRYKAHYHGATLTTFIRMMGIYPPGSVVQLTDERYAMVVSVNSSRPIKPQVIIHQSSVPADDALIVNLEHETQLGIHRSLRPVQMPKAAYDYLSPRKRLCYFFERHLTAAAPEDKP